MSISENHIPRRNRNLINTNGTRRMKLLAERGYRCVGCGYVGDDVGLHHIVPIALGGLDEEPNIAVLCQRCHDAVHDLSLETLRKPFANRAGRHRSCPPETEESAYWEFLSCQTGTKQTKAILGIKESSKITDRAGFKEYIEKHNIEAHRNNIDTILKKSGEIKRGQQVGYIRYSDGTEIKFYYGEEPKSYKTHIQ